MRALTFIQPFATAALTVKPYDNRKLAPPKSVIGQRIAIHAGAKYDSEGRWGTLVDKVRAAWHARGWPLSLVEPDWCIRSHLIGTVLLRGYLRRTDPAGDWAAFGVDASEVQAIVESGWIADGALTVWVFGDPVSLPEPIPMRGAQGLWNVPERFLPEIGVAHG